MCFMVHLYMISRKKGVIYSASYLHSIGYLQHDFKHWLKIGMLKGDTCTMQDKPGFLRNLKVKYL